MSEKKERFGRYLILDHLVDGGMAKICRARFLGEQADKVVAIKMIQPQYSSDESFKQMFMDEIKVTFGLLHPNIVQTYDYGLHKDQLFVAMEYCDGRNLKEYLDRLRQKKFVFPVEISAYIISQVCQGLNYAHTFTDKLSGKAANIVHRDISPHNIMLTYDGAVKVIDFGIAKANSNSEATQAGTIKGKLSYLAPEYLEGHDLDPRYDMFAVGITLWEMLCSRKLFKAANDLAVLKKIQECKVPPPSKINPNVPVELDEIVLKALKKDRNKRFENMDQFNRALIKFLYANYPDFNSSDLSYFAKELFKEEIKKDRERLFEFGKIDVKPYINDWKREQEGGIGATSSSSDSGDTSSAPAGRKKEQVLDFGFDEEETATKTGHNGRSRRTKTKVGGSVKKTRSDMSISGMEDGNMKLENLTQGRRRRGDPEPGTGTVKKKKKGGTKAGTSIHKLEKEKKMKEKARVRIIGLVATIAALVWFGKDELPIIKDLLKERKPASEAVVVKENTLKEPDTSTEVRQLNEGGVRITNYSTQYHRVFLDGEEVKPNFLKKIKVPVKKEFWLRIERAGYRPYVEKMSFNSKNENVEITIPKMKNEAFGYLYLSRGCQMYGELTFDLYGERRSERVPFVSQIGLPLPIDGDGRTPANDDGNAVYTLYFKKFGTNVQRKIEVSFKHEEERIDICGM